MGSFADFKMTNNIGLTSYGRSKNIAEQMYQAKIPYVQTMYDKQFAITRDGYDRMIDLAKKAYVGTENPDTMINKKALGQVINYVMPNVDSEYAEENAEELMYMATGYRADVDKWGEHIINTLRSSGSSYLASLKIAGLYLGGIFDDDETFEQKKEDALKDIERHAMNYNTGAYLDDKGIFNKMVTEAANILPSTLPSIAISGVMAAVSILSGGTAIPATTIGLIKAWKTLSSSQKILGLTSASARMATSSLMEMGGIALDLSQQGFDREVILPISAGVGIINGTFEVLGDSLEGAIVKPLETIVEKFGKKTTNELVRQTFKETLLDAGKDYIKSIATEPATEVLQELSTMLGYNLAVNIQKKSGKNVVDAIGYTSEQISDALKEVYIKTLQGTLVLGAGSGMLNIASQLTVGDLGKSMLADRVSNPDGANVILSKGKTDAVGNKVQTSEKVDAVPVVRIGDKYYTYKATPEQNYIASEKSQFYAKKVDFKADMTNAIQYSNPMTMQSINDAVVKGLKNGIVTGVTFFDEEGNSTYNPKITKSVAIQVEGLDTVIVDVAEKNSASKASFEADVFNQTFDKILDEDQVKTESPDIDANKAATPDISEVPVSEYESDDSGELDYLSQASELFENMDIESIEEIDSSVETETQKDLQSTDLQSSESTDIADEIQETTRTQNDQSGEVQTQSIKESTEGGSEPARSPSVAYADESGNVSGMEAREAKANEISYNKDVFEQSMASVSDVSQFEDIRSIANEFESLYSQTDIGNNSTATRKIAESTAVALAGFARAQGKTVKEFREGINKISVGDSGKRNFGLYDIENNQIVISKNARPSTLMHEISHYFLQTLQDGDLKEYILKQFNGKSIDDIQESFAKAFERYVYIGDTKNPRLIVLFSQLKNICKEIWKGFSDKTKLTKKIRSTFDAIFNDGMPPVVDTSDIDKSIEKAGDSINKNKLVADEAKREYIAADSQSSSTLEEKIDTQVNEDMKEVAEISQAAKDSVEPVKKPTKSEISDMRYTPKRDIANISVDNAKIKIIPLSEEKVESMKLDLKENIKNNAVYGAPGYEIIGYGFTEISDKETFNALNKFAGVSGITNKDISIFKDEFGSLFIYSNKKITTDGESNYVEDSDPRWYYCPVNNSEDFTTDSVYAKKVSVQYVIKNNYKSDYKDLFDKDIINMDITKYKYPSKAVAESVLRTMTYEFPKTKKKLYSAEEDINRQKTISNIADFIIDTIDIESFDQIYAKYNELKESGKADDFYEWLQSYEDISKYMSGLDELTRADIAYQIAMRIQYSKQSYSSVANMLSEAFKNKTGLENSKELFMSLYRKAVDAAGGFNNLHDSLKKFFENPEETQLFEDVSNAMKIRGKTQITSDQFKKFLSLIVSKSGKLKNVYLDENTGYYNSFLIELLNFAHITEGNSSRNALKYVDGNYLEASQSLLKSSQIGFSSQATKNVNANIFNIMKAFAATEGTNIGRILYTVNSKSESVVNYIMEKYQNKAKQIVETTEALKKNYDEKLHKYKQMIVDLQAKENTPDAEKKEKNKTRIDNLKNEIFELKAQIAEQQAMIKNILDGKEYSSLLYVKKQYEDLYNSIDKASRNTDARAALEINRIVKNVRTKGTKVKGINPDMFKSKWKDHQKYLDMIRNVLEMNDIIKKEGDFLVLNRSLNSLDISQLSSVVDVINSVFEIAQEDRDARISERNSMKKRYHNAILADLISKANLTEDEYKEVVDAYRKTRRLGSQTEEAKKSGGLLSDSLAQFETMENRIMQISTVLHSYIFYGVVDGRFVGTDLNTMSNNELRSTNERLGKFNDIISEAFGIEKTKVSSRIEELFSRDTMSIGSISVEQFKNSTKLELGSIEKFRNKYYKIATENVDERYEAIANIILSRQKEYTEQIDKYERTSKQIEKVMNDLKKNPDDEKLQNKLEKLQDELIENEPISEEEFLAEEIGTPSDAKFTMQQLMGIYIYAQNMDSLSDMLSYEDKMTNNLSLGNILYVMNEFETNPEFEPYKKVADSMISIATERYDALADVLYESDNKILDYKRNYFHVKHDVDAEAYNIQARSSLSKGIKEINPKMSLISELYDRSPSRKALQLDVIDMFPKMIKDQEHAIAFTLGMNEINELFENGSDFSDAFKAISSNEKKDTSQRDLDNINKWLNLIANGNSIKVDATTSIISKLRHNMVVSVLWGNITSVLQQYPTFMLVARKVGLVDAIGSLKIYLGSKKSIDDIIYSKSEQMKDRRRYERYVYEQTKSNQRTELETKVQKFLVEKMKLDENKDYTLKAKQGYREIIEFGMKWLEKSDEAVSNAMWWALYNDNYKKLDREGLTDEQFDILCSNKATQDVLSMNPSQNVKDNALAYSSNSEMLKTILLFTSQMNKQFNIIYGSARDFWSEKNMKNFKVMLNDLLWIGFVSGAAGFISGKMIPSDDDDLADILIWNVLKSTLTEMSGMIPAVGSTIRDFFNGDIFADTGAIGATTNLVNVISKDKKDRKENQLLNAWSNFISEYATILGVPSNAPQKFLKFISNDLNPGYILNSGWGRAFDRED